ncbi:MAG: helix-hairpin-helix domain-containing protein [candidate division WOR-3 bacterium]
MLDLNRKEILAISLFFLFVLIGEIGLWYYKVLNPPKYEVLKKPNEEIILKDSIKKVSLNNSSYEELLQVPGIGPTLAKRIIENRPYEKIEDLMKVKGIGKKKFEKIKNYFEP